MSANRQIKNFTMANLLKIATTFTETKSIEKEIELPYYFKHKHGGFIYKVVSDKYAIQVCTFDEHLGTSLCPASLYKEKLAAGTPIEQFEFDAAYQKAMMYVDLINKNQDPSNENDENVEIDQMREAS